MHTEARIFGRCCPGQFTKIKGRLDCTIYTLQEVMVQHIHNYRGDDPNTRAASIELELIGNVHPIEGLFQNPTPPTQDENR